MTRDPYADLGEVFAEETSRRRIRVRPTPKTPTELDPEGAASDAILPAPFGYHIDGDKRYQER